MGDSSRPAGAPGRRLRHQLGALRPPAAAARTVRAASSVPNPAPAVVAPMAEVDDAFAVDAAAMQYQRSGYTILRDAIPAELLHDLQARFEHHASAHIQTLGPRWREDNSGRLTFCKPTKQPVVACDLWLKLKRLPATTDELNDDEGFGRLADLLTHHPIVQKIAATSWNGLAPEIDHKPYGSVLHGGQPSDGSWHVDAQGPLPRYKDYNGPEYPYPTAKGVPLIPFMLRASILMDDVTDEMGPTCLMPGSQGTRHMPPPWVHSGSQCPVGPDCPGCFNCSKTGQPRAIPGMVRFTGQAGDLLLNNVSIWHTSGPNTTEETRKLAWILWGPEGGLMN